MKRLKSVETEQVQLEIVECDCGYHMGIDASYLDQVGDFITTCPSCKKTINTKSVLPEEYSVDGTVNVCCHNVSWWFKSPSEISDSLKKEMETEAEERAKSQLIEGYQEGELCFLDTSTETEYRGWWSIQKD
jgi:arginine utilization protein RocB